MVEHGFRSLYTSKGETTRYNKLSASEQVMSEIKHLAMFYQEKGEKVSITITGHSLGGALDLLNAYEAALAFPTVPVSVISFGAPRVGNEAFADRLKELGVKVLRVVIKQDVVPKMPGIMFNEGIKIVEQVTGTLEWVYTHVGVELGLNVRTSPYLKNCINFAGFHNLEIYLHLVDGFMSSKSGFRREAKRDVALINKASGMLREEIGIPPCWYQPANRGLVCNSYGRWVMPNREPEDIPSPYREGHMLVLN
jgi:Lipase (class 3)